LHGPSPCLLLSHGFRSGIAVEGAVYNANARIISRTFLGSAITASNLGCHQTPGNQVKTLADRLFQIREGARVMARDNEGKTPLDYAETARIIKLLEANGATEK